MIALVLAPIAFAAEVHDDEVVAAVEVLYGRDLPAGAVCIARPDDLPGRFRDLVVAGAKRGARGCVVVGVLIDDKLVEPEAAATAAIDTDAWKMVDDAQRADDLLAWVDTVLLAFDQPEGRGTARREGDGFTVERTFLHRTEDKGTSARSSGTWVFGAAGALLDTSSTPEATWKTGLTVRPDHLEGIASDTVQTAMTSQGGTITDCFLEAWNKDLSLSGAVKLGWTVTAGKVDGLTLIADPQSPAPESLAKCYARAIRKLDFPEAATGSIRWVFVADRREAE